jgi:hypothetical protein
MYPRRDKAFITQRDVYPRGFLERSRTQIRGDARATIIGVAGVLY